MGPWDDQLVLDGLEPVTFRSVRRNGPHADTVVPNACRLPSKLAERAPTGGTYQAATADWSIRLAELTGVSPEPGDAVIDGTGAAWTVIDLTRAPLAGFVRLNTLNLAIAYALKDSVTVERPVSAADPAALRVVGTWFPVANGVAGRVQPETSDLADKLGKRAVEKLYTVYLAAPVAVLGRERVRWNGRAEALEVLGFDDPERIDELFRLRCRLTVT